MNLKIFSKSHVLVFSLFLFGCSIIQVSIKPIPRSEIFPEVKNVSSGRNVRVLLFNKNKKILTSSKNEIKIFDMDKNRIITTIPGNAVITIGITNNQWVIGNRLIHNSNIRIISDTCSFIQINNSNYRGQIEFSVNSSRDDFSVINYISIEEYLKGVVPEESSATWPLEALKAQAIAARTFTLEKIRNTHNNKYDVDATVNSQVYGGVNSEKPSSNQAVEETRNIVIIFKNNVIAAFYHSNCGGHTADVQKVWGSHLPYLSGIICCYCENGPHFKWKYEITKNALIAMFEKKRINLDGLSTLERHNIDLTGRVGTIDFQTSKGTTSLKATVFRMLVGADRIKSTNFMVKDLGDSFVFKGQGWGHGVGMCQEGARGMALQNFNYKEILHYYYPGTELRILEDN